MAYVHVRQVRLLEAEVEVESQLHLNLELLETRQVRLLEVKVEVQRRVRMLTRLLESCKSTLRERLSNSSSNFGSSLLMSPELILRTIGCRSTSFAQNFCDPNSGDTLDRPSPIAVP